MAITALGVADEMELDMFPVEIGDLIENVAAVVVENRDALRGFDDGYQTHCEGYGAARISVECELVPAGEESADKAIKVVLIFGEMFVRGKDGEPYKLALFAEAMRGRQGEGYMDEWTGSERSSGQGLPHKDRDAYDSSPCTCPL